MKRSHSHRPDLFLCHSTVDKEFVRRLARDLHDLSVYAWFDEWELAPGDSLHDSIGRAIEESHYVGVVLSPDSVKSNWCKKELNQALSRETRSGKKVVIPIRYRAAEMPAFLEDKLYVDFSEQYAVSLTLLAAHIHSLDQRTIREALSAEEPIDVNKVIKILRKLGLANETKLGTEDWIQLMGLLRKHSIHVSGSRLSIIHPQTGRRHDVK